MKNNMMTVKPLALLYTTFFLTLCGFLVSCDDEDDIDDGNNTEEVAIQNGGDVLAADTEFDEAFFVVDEAMDETSGSRSSTLCADISVDTVDRDIVIDFGTGCTSTLGVERSGRIDISYIGRYRESGGEFSVSFTDYTVNGNTLNGSLSIGNYSLNADNQITFTIEVDNGSLTTTDNETITYTSTKTYTFIEGFKNFDVSDNVYSIEGSFSGITRDEVSYSVNVDSAVLLQRTCLESGDAVASSGSLAITLSTLNLPIGIDFGDGTCDTQATLTYGAFTQPINLR